jgi:hypothetical protein
MTIPSSKQAELVVVDDMSTDNVGEILQTLGVKAFERVRHVKMDKKLSIIPVVHNNPALGINLAVKHAKGPIIVKTDPECYPLCDVVEFAKRFASPHKLHFATLHRGAQPLNDSLLGLVQDATLPASVTAIDEQFRRGDLWERKGFINPTTARWAYWFTSVFMRSMFHQVGGIDERFLKGFAGEDDEWAERMRRNGCEYTWTPDLEVIHLYHTPPQNTMKDRNWHVHNKSLLEDARNRRAMVANADHDWGSNKSVVAISEYHE